MKSNKNKIIVSALALAIGGSLAGSVGSTIAWYQYSTRANVSFLGQASGISGNLHMRFVGETDWTTRITWQQLATHLGQTGTELKPMTFGGLGITDALPLDTNDKLEGYTQPLPGKANMTDWYRASEKNYAQFQLELRYVERDGALDNQKDDKNVEKEVYLSKLLIEEDANNIANMGDISDAVRIHVSALEGSADTQSDDRLISKNGGSTLTHGKMDLDGDGKNDTAWADGDEWGFGKQDTDLEEIEYGDGANKVQKSLNYGNAVAAGKSYDNSNTLIVEDTYPACVKTNNNDMKLTGTEDMTIDNDTVHKYIGKTLAEEDDFLTVTVTIWVEGWHKFDYSARTTTTPNNYSIWDADLTKAKFDLGLQFAVQEE